MSETENKTAVKNEEGLLSSTIPVVVSAVVAIGCTFAYDRLFRESPVAAMASSPTLVLSLEDWIKEIPANATPEKMEEVFFKARQSAQVAARAGYVVVDESNVIAAPQSARLLPGMFEPKGN